jgi:hyperosmotically inducible protein
MSNEDDRELSARVKATLDNNQETAPYGISVDANDGVVLIQGIVDVLKERKRAGDIVWSVPGVRGVDNALTISTDGQVNDEGVMAEVMEELKADHEIDLKEVGASVQGGTVTLKGRVGSSEEEAHAIEVATKARGVVNVVSQLDIVDEDDKLRITPRGMQKPEAYKYQDQD